MFYLYSLRLESAKKVHVLISDKYGLPYLIKISQTKFLQVLNPWKKELVYWEKTPQPWNLVCPKVKHTLNNDAITLIVFLGKVYTKYDETSTVTWIYFRTHNRLTKYFLIQFQCCEWWCEFQGYLEHFLTSKAQVAVAMIWN